jgi:acylphosphatase/Zn finger protein HypA/HybF involved in hydrogenase expression
MHEFGITERLFQIALTQAGLRDGERIRCLLINLDPDSGYAPDAVRFYFEQLARNTPAEGAELAFELVSQPQHISLSQIEIDEAPAETEANSSLPAIPSGSHSFHASEPPHPIARWGLQLSGEVQAAGFQSFLHILTFQLGLSGWVRYTAAGAELELQGPAGELDHFLSHLRHDAPPPARIAEVETTSLPLVADQPPGLEIRICEGQVG